MFEVIYHMTEHKYETLANKLRADISAGVYSCGEKLPSENELAAETGFSRQTVRQAMAILEKSGFTVRIQGSGTYVSSTVPRRKLTHNIAVVTTYIGEYIFPNILQGINDVLNENGFTSLLSATENRIDNERRILTELLDKPVDGLIVEGTKTALPNPNIDLYEKLSEHGIPVVFINGFYPELRDFVYVVADDRAGGRTACEYLLNKGHTKIAGIFKSDDIQGHRRYAGFAEALFSAGRSVNDDNVLWYTTENRDALISNCALKAIEGCTGVVCYNDMVTLQLLKLFSDNGIGADKRPELVSFDCSTFAAISSVPFKSLSNPKEMLGRLAAKKMINIINGTSESSITMSWEDVEKNAR